jgi:hypothetical protein
LRQFISIYLEAAFLTILGQDALIWRVDADADESHNVIVLQIPHLLSDGTSASEFTSAHATDLQQIFTI